MTMTLETVTPTQLEQLRQSGKRIDLIDVRTPAEFREIHVAYARNVPLDALDPQAIMQGREESCDQPLFVVCRSGARGKQACEKFVAAGYCNVINVEGGTLACESAGLPVVRGKKTLPLDRQVRIAIGTLVLAGAVLAWLVHPAFIGLSALCGAGLIFAGITDTCPLAMTIARMPWNQVQQESRCCGS
jgi:rhodanese-related sulfurtransferase